MSPFWSWVAVITALAVAASAPLWFRAADRWSERRVSRALDDPTWRKFRGGEWR